MSSLRPTLVHGNMPGLNYQQTYYRVLEAVLARRTLIHGRLKDSRGHACAIGCYFQDAHLPISNLAIDEIAGYNDSFPKLSERQRWYKVRAWLRFRIKQLRNGRP